MVLEYKDEPPASLAQIVSSGDLAALERHLSSGRSVFAKSSDGQSLLHLCALSNDRPMAQCLLDHDKENTLINAKNGSRQTAFALAVEEESIEVASLLIERGCALGGFVNTVMEQLEAGTEDEETRKLLKPLATRLNKSSRGPFLVHKAISGNHPSILKTLLDSGFDPNEKDEHGMGLLVPLESPIDKLYLGIYAIFYAVHQNNTLSIRYLAAAGANLNAYLPEGPFPTIGVSDNRDYTPLLLAANTVQNVPLLRLLLELGADPNFVMPVYRECLPFSSSPPPHKGYDSQRILRYNVFVRLMHNSV
jgi:hypothetical protein